MCNTTNGQVTIGQKLQEEAGLVPGSRGQKLVEDLRAGGDFKMTTDEVFAIMRGPRPDES